jgi:hypothetical protein
VREIVIVIGDLYLQAAADALPGSGARWGSGPAYRGGGEEAAPVPALEHLARFGEKKTLAEGWRAWTARWLGLVQHAREAPACVAAAVLANAPADRAVWLATPLHWVAGLTSLHVDRRSVLRLSGADSEQLAASFRDTFRGSGFELHPLAAGELLVAGPAQLAQATTTEPARMLLMPVAESLPAGEGASALRRLSAEIEMWLHDHPVNDARARRGAPPLATLWLWGGGVAAASRATASREVIAAAFGSEAYVRGLWRLGGGETRPMPVDWAAMIGEPHAPRALAVVEVAELLHANASWRLDDALAEIDRRLLSPSLAALQRGELERLVLLANDRSLAVRAADRLRFWRRKRTGLEGLM